MQLIDLDLSRWRSFALYDSPVPAFAEPLRSFLGRHLSSDQLRLLALPVRHGDAFQWFVHGSAPVVAIDSLAEPQRSAAQRAFFDHKKKIDDVVSNLQSGRISRPAAVIAGRSATAVGEAGHRERERFVALLSRLNLTPDRRLVFVQDGIPIRVGWGGALLDDDMFVDPRLIPMPITKPAVAPRSWLGRLGRSLSAEVDLAPEAACLLRAEAEQRITNHSLVAAGANRITLMWENANDLDLSLIAPDGQRVYFGKKSLVFDGAVVELDIDMNAATSGHGFDKSAPVENITIDRFAADGRWQVVVTHFKHRLPAPLSCGFRVALQLEDGIRLVQGALAPGHQRTVAFIETRGGKLISFVGNG